MACTCDSKNNIFSWQKIWASKKQQKLKLINDCTPRKFPLSTVWCGAFPTVPCLRLGSHVHPVLRTITPHGLHHLKLLNLFVTPFLTPPCTLSLAARLWPLHASKMSFSKVTSTLLVMFKRYILHPHLSDVAVKFGHYLPLVSRTPLSWSPPPL